MHNLGVSIEFLLLGLVICVVNVVCLICYITGDCASCRYLRRRGCDSATSLRKRYILSSGGIKWKFVAILWCKSGDNSGYSFSVGTNGIFPTVLA